MRLIAERAPREAAPPSLSAADGGSGDAAEGAPTVWLGWLEVSRDDVAHKDCLI